MIIFEKDSLNRTVVEIVFKNAGSIFAKPSTAYFLSHIFNTKGTLKKKEKIYSEMEEDAIEFHAGVNREFFTLSMKFLNDKSQKALKFLSEILTEANITEEAFEKSKNEIKAKIENKKNDHDYTANKNLFKAVFKNTPHEYPVMGENVENVTLDDIKKFYNGLFFKEYVIINGGNELDFKHITSLFSPKKEKAPFFRPAKCDDIKEFKNVEQSYIYFCSPFDVDYSKDLHLAKIATFILGAGGFGSRMMEEIRVKRGYAYSAYATNSFKKTYSILSGHLQTKLENTQNAIEIVNSLIEEFYKKGITEEELIQAKQFLIGSEPLRNETLNQRLLRKFNEHYLNLPEGYYEKELKLIQNSSVDEVNAFLKSHPEITQTTYSIVTKE